jgi:hypothetical protein
MVQIYGIDLGMSSFDVSFLSESGSVRHLSGVKNTVHGISKFLLSLPSAAVLCAEHTGVYGDLLLRLCTLNRICLCFVPGYQIKHSLGLQRGKSDPLDACRIREYAETYGCKYVAEARPWNEKADIALPCATQNELNGEDAQNLIKNDVLCVGEISNMGCTPEAIDLFIEHKTMYAPGKAVNAGGVATSGLEMSQNAMHLSWSAAEVDEKLHAIMHGIHAQCVKYGTEPDGYINYVKGANIAGFMKVAHAMMGQGVI